MHRDILGRFIDGSTEYLDYSPTLGWTIKDNGRYALYRANSAGLRGTREYEREPSEGTLRISTFGDSFTHCDEVENNDTWQVRLVRSVKTPSSRS